MNEWEDVTQAAPQIVSQTTPQTIQDDGWEDVPQRSTESLVDTLTSKGVPIEYDNTGNVGIDYQRYFGQPEQSNLAGISSALSQGTSLKFSDEIAGYLGAGIDKLAGNPLPYDTLRKINKSNLLQRATSYQEENPYTGYGTEIGGGLATAALTRVPPSVSKLPAIGQGAVIGGAFGGITGAGAASEGDKLLGGLTGSLFGAGAGALIAPLIPYATNLLNKAVVTPAGKAIDKIRQFTGQSPPGLNAQASAQKLLLKGLEESGLTPQAVKQQLSTLSPEIAAQTMLADTSPGLQQVGQYAASHSLAARNLVEERLKERASSTLQKITDPALRRLVGTNKNDVIVADEVLKAGKAAAAPFYKQVDETLVPMTKELVELIKNNPTALQAYRQGVFKAKSDITWPKGINDGVKILDDIIKSVDSSKNPVFIRWSAGSKYDLAPNAFSRDYVSGAQHQGLSAIELSKGMTRADMAKYLNEYRFSKIKDPNIKPFLYEGKVLGKDSDGYVSISPTKLIGELPSGLQKILNGDLVRKLELESAISDASNRLLKITDPIGKDLVSKNLLKYKQELSSLASKFPGDIKIPSVADLKEGSTVPLRALDLMKRSLNDMASTALRKGANDAARNPTNIAQKLTSILDDSFPFYKQAREIYQGSKSFENAIELGKKVLRTDDTVFGQELSKLNSTDRQGAMIGAYNAIRDKFLGAKVTGNEAERLSTTLLRDRLQNVARSPEELNAFTNTLDSVSNMFETQRQIIGGSPTAIRDSFNKLIDQYAPGGGLNKDTLKAIPGRALDNVLRKYSTQSVNQTEQFSVDLADMLTRRGPKEMLPVLESLIKHQDKMTPQMREQLSKVLAAGLEQKAGQAGAGIAERKRGQ